MTKLRNWAITKAVEIRTRDEEAQGLAEYGLILALVAVLCVGALGLLQTGIDQTLSDVAGHL